MSASWICFLFGFLIKISMGIAFSTSSVIVLSFSSPESSVYFSVLFSETFATLSMVNV